MSFSAFVLQISLQARKNGSMGRSVCTSWLCVEGRDNLMVSWSEQKNTHKSEVAAK